jgi:menaquinone-dependent protoporphyrinogen IX oxidase
MNINLSLLQVTEVGIVRVPVSIDQREYDDSKRHQIVIDCNIETSEHQRDDVKHFAIRVHLTELSHFDMFRSLIVRYDLKACLTHKGLFFK